MITTKLEEFGIREREMAIELLQVWNEKGLPDGFHDNSIEIMFNKDSGFVFLANSQYQSCLVANGKLVLWLSCSNCGAEGFEGDITLIEDNCSECSTQSQD